MFTCCSWLKKTGFAPAGLNNLSPPPVELAKPIDAVRIRKGKKAKKLIFFIT
jgi:hypothetical protein